MKTMTAGRKARRGSKILGRVSGNRGAAPGLSPAQPGRDGGAALNRDRTVVLAGAFGFVAADGAWIGAVHGVVNVPGSSVGREGHLGPGGHLSRFQRNLRGARRLLIHPGNTVLG